MPELVSITAIRDAQSLSPKEIDKIGIKTHPENLHSERYNHWLNLCEAKEYKSLKMLMENFLKSEEAIKSYNQITPDLGSIIKFSEYNGYNNFDIKEFAKQVDLRKMKNEFGKEIKESGCYNHASPFFNLITNFNDQLLAKTQSNISIKHEFNLQGAIKTLKLAETIYLNGREKLQLNIEKHFAKPLIINSCILEIDPCSLLHRIPEKIKENTSKINPDGTTSENSNKKKECRCKEVEQDCECKCNDECVEQNPCCAKITPYVAELFVVRDELCKYEPGEISYIENVMESEIRVRKHRHLQRGETHSEQEEDINTYEEKDLQVDEQFSLHKEIDKVVEQSLSVDAGATYSNNSSIGGTVGGLTIGASKKFSTTLDTSYNWSKKEARKQVQDESKNVISKAISRVEKKIRTLSTKKLLNEIEEKNKHVFGGTTGAEKDMSRQFYYVNQVRKAQVFSYGKRAMLDFYLPEPSELLKRLVEKQFDLKKPVKPCINIEDIGTSKSDWLEYIQCYGFTELEQPPVAKKSEFRYISVDKNTQEVPDFTVPEGYTATRIEYFSGHANPKDIRFNNDAYIQIKFGSTIIQRKWKDEITTEPQDISYTGTVRVKMEEDKCGNDANLTVRITITPDPIDYIPWQLEVHKLLLQKYENEIAEYNKALADYERSKENHFNKNPFILSEMMKEQLKHSAISYITCQFFDENNAMKNKVEPCGFPQMDIPESKLEGDFVRFIEQAFEWKFMNYMLYPYFWGRKCSWEDKFQEESENYLFTKFLKSGYARVSISVRPGFEGMVDYYLRTRKIWDGGEPPIMGEAFVPIHQEIKESKDNFNADRKGHLTWDDSIDTNLSKNEILLIDNLDYFTEDVDPVSGNGLGTYTFDKYQIDVDINSEITINCITYRIIDIQYNSTIDTIKFVLDRDLEIDCCCSENGKEFDDIYNKKHIPWSTGAEFVGAPWKFKVPTSLTWLREEGGCLPCYPIKCE